MIVPVAMSTSSEAKTSSSGDSWTKHEQSLNQENVVSDLRSMSDGVPVFIGKYQYVNKVLYVYIFFK